MIMNTKKCQNPLCDSQAVFTVEILATASLNNKRIICPRCHEVYRWGLHRGESIARRQRLWVLAIADRGMVAFAQAYSSQERAEQGLIDYLRTEENYTGPDEISAAASWLADHDERLGAEIFEAEPDMDDDNLVPGVDLISKFLNDQGFIVLGRNQQDANPELPFEAWAYQGPLDFQAAQPVTFSLAENPMQALHNLSEKLGDLSPQAKGASIPKNYQIAAPPDEKDLFRVVYVIDVGADDVTQAAWNAYEMMSQSDALPPVLEVINNQGDRVRIDLSRRKKT